MHRREPESHSREFTVGDSATMAALRELRGQRVTRVAIEQWSIHFVFESALLVVEGKWELRSADGTVIDRGIELDARSEFRLWTILGQRIVNATVESSPFSNLILDIENNYRFLAMGDDDGLEDWSLIGDDQRFILIVNGIL